jgi:hypothetical protein
VSTTQATCISVENGVRCPAPVFIKKHQLCKLHYDRFNKRKQRTGTFDTSTDVAQGRPRIEYSRDAVRAALASIRQ